MTPDTCAPSHELVELQRARKRICTQSSASKMAPMECGHPGFSVLLMLKSSQEVVKSAQKIKNTVQLVVREEPILRFEFRQRDVTDRLRAP